MKTSASLSVQFDNIFSPFPGQAWEDGLDWVKASGFDAVEIILSDPDLIDRKKLTKKLEQLDLPVSTISTGQAMGLEALSLVSPSRHTRELTLGRLERDIDFACQLGKPHVTIGLIRGRGGAAPEDMERYLLRDSLSRIAEYAEAKGVVLNLEAINRYECKYLNSSEETLQLLHEIGDPSCMGVLYDTFHSNIEDASMVDAIHALRGRITNVHLADSNRRLPGEGHIDFDAVVSALLADGYEGYAALEVLNVPNAAHIQKNARDSIRYVMKGKA